MRMNIMHQLSILRLFELFGKSYLPKKFFDIILESQICKTVSGDQSGGS